MEPIDELKEKIARQKIDIHVVQASGGDISETAEDELPKWFKDAGVLINGSIATRGSCGGVVDEFRVRKYDLHAAYARRSTVRYFIFTLLILCGAVWLFATGYWIWGLETLPVLAFATLMSLLSGNIYPI